jgi:hypothetical protein
VQGAVLRAAQRRARILRRPLQAVPPPADRGRDAAQAIADGRGVRRTLKGDYMEIGDKVLVRTYSAGVHIGTLAKREGKEVTLTNAVRLWSWSGAFTLSAVATVGVDRKSSRISVPVPEILLTEAIEILPVADGVDLSTTE